MPAEEDEGTISRARPKGKSTGSRRRLTVTHTIGDDLVGEIQDLQEKAAAVEDADDAGGRRGSTRTMKMHQALEIPKTQNCKHRCSISGEVTSKDFFLPFFANKAMNFSGVEEMKSLSLGVVCHRGQKPESCNQDDFFFICVDGILIYGVLDGHGKEGEIISHFAQTHLPNLVLEDGAENIVGEGIDTEAKLKRAFLTVQEMIEKEHPNESFRSGCTATLVVQCPQKGKLVTAHVGDSTAVIARREKGKKGAFRAEVLTSDHKPNRPDERQRIEASGGEVSEPAGPGLPWRLVTPEAGLAVSRSLGDCCTKKYGLSAEPEVKIYDINDAAEDYFVLACSDGVWEFLNAAQVVQMCGRFEPTDAQSAAEKLVHKAQLRWQEQESVVDDITVILAWGGYDLSAAGGDAKASAEAAS